jgi:mRNA-degrading endonuclease RelE of RelBE toxin-antitoxin system
LAEPRLTARAKGDLANLPRKVQEAVIETLTMLGAEPPAVGKPLIGRLRGLWSARVGNYRILYTVEEGRGTEQVIVRAILHRGVAYQSRPN